MLQIIHGESSRDVAASQLQASLVGLELDGTLYLGYPVLSSADEKVFIDALLIAEQCGLVAFDLSSPLPTHLGPGELAMLSERQNQMYACIYNKLNTHKDLRKGRGLALEINILTCHPNIADVVRAEEENVWACPPRLTGTILTRFDPLEPSLLRPLTAAIQRVSTLRPVKRRESVTKPDSRGALLKRLEREIANLDQWQNRGAIEYTNGPQRIRGLAGSGKTVVLALKAAYLHVRHPEWTIGVTFQSRALYQQFRDLIRRFTFEQIEDEPDWSKLLVLHAWGSQRAAGVYSMICGNYGVTPYEWRAADLKYGSRAFEGACQELNKVIEQQGPKPIFDVLLIDEAQDFPTAFYRMVHHATAEPHRIIWAYDDLQNLGDYEMRSEHELFGTDQHGSPLVTLRNNPNAPMEDIVLPVCYRNTPWVLTTAHALGFGIYRPEDLVQIFAEPTIWTRIGYEVVRGELRLDQDVAVRRSRESYPRYFEELLRPEDVIEYRQFPSEEAQYIALAGEIKKNLQEDELEPTDILVVLPDAYTSRRTGGAIMSSLLSQDIPAHIVGVTSSRDEILKDNSVAITHIYRAKGNEAPMVYIVNAEYCHGGFELKRKRNILFTAITRSRCWVRLLGVGPQMAALCAEIDKVRQNRYELSFHYPNPEQMKRLAQAHRDMTDQERRGWERKIGTVEEVLRAISQGELPLEALPEEVRAQLTKTLKKDDKRSKKDDKRSQ